MNFTITGSSFSSKRAPHQLLRAMKLTMILLMAACIQVSATGFGQKVSISGKDLPLEKVFSIIKKQTGYVFFYDYSIFQGAKSVSLDLKDADIEDVLKTCLQGQNLDFSITNKTISIIRKEEKKAESIISGPGKTVKAQGVVMTEGGQPLSGANVTVKETGHGTITNVKGEFQITEAPVNGTLVISFIGYAPQKVKITEGTAIQIYLTIAKNELDKVVVQAYGNTTERLNTGNISTVSAAEIEKQPVANVLTALQGKVPGLVVQQTSGYASAPFKVELRGRAQIDGSLPSEPLYIIDGVPLTILENPNAGGNYANGSVGFTQNGIGGPASGQSPFFSINPNDIESISVLKDADASAIYGSRGANGVILIATKKGKAGKTKLELNAYQGISEVSRRYSMLNTQQYLAMRHEAFANDKIIPNAGNAYDLLTWDTTRYTDWQKYMWGGTGKTTDLTLNLAGGDKQTTFRIGGTYHRETDILTVSGASQRASVQFNLSHKSLDQRLGISFTSTYSYTYLDLLSSLGAPALPPDAPTVFTPTGQLNWKGWQPSSNPFSLLLQPYTAKTGFLNSQLSLSYELVKNVNVDINLGYSSSHQSQLRIRPIASQNPLSNPKGSAQFGNNNNSNAIVEPQLHYKTFIGRGKLEALVGASVQSVSQDGNQIQGNGYTDDNLLHSISNAPTQYAVDNTAQYKYGALFTRLNYNWENKYLLNLSARRDGSSRFGPGKQFGNFGAIGAAWIFTEENWAQKTLSFLSFGKLRGSYGLTGSDNIGNYQYLTNWSGSSVAPYYQTTNVYVPLIHANPNLQWQVNKKAEAALDLGFLADRITFELAWYQNLCSNQLVIEPLSIITGFNQVTANLPATVRNRGWESSFRAKVIDSKVFEWSVNGNIGINRNKLIAFPGLSQSPYASLFVVGKSLNVKNLLHYTGIDPQTGQYMVEDRNHDGRINIRASDTANDFYKKDLSIKYEGGFGTDFRYKNWQLSLFFRFRKQEILGNIASIGTPGGMNIYPTNIFNRWQKPGDKAEYARFTTQPKASDQYFGTYSDGVYCDGSYIRLQNLSLTYNLPTLWLKKSNIRDVKLFFHGENLFLITKYKGLDPDTPQYGAMPPAKILAGGLQFNF